MIWPTGHGAMSERASKAQEFASKEFLYVVPKALRLKAISLISASSNLPLVTKLALPGFVHLRR